MMNNNDQLEAWRTEQLEIASAVEIIPDADSGDHGIKHLSFSTKQDDAKRVGGVDVSFGDNDLAVAVYVITKGEEIIYQDSVTYTLDVPYVSSYLAFREIEPLTELVMKQKQSQPEVTPEVIIVDGNGIFHERRAGIACFLGVRTNMCTIGVSKKLYCMDGLDHKLVSQSLEKIVNAFVGKMINNDTEAFSKKSHNDMGAALMIDEAIQPLSSDQVIDDIIQKPSHSLEINVQTISQICDGFSIPIMNSNGTVLAAALIAHGAKIGQRTAAGKAKNKGGTKVPIFVSIGHKISLQEAIRICVSTSFARIPESVRKADLIGRELIRNLKRK